MKKLNFLSNFSLVEKGLLILALFVLYFSIQFISNDSSIDQLLNGKVTSVSEGDSLGSIVSQSNDTRYKPGNSFSWSKSDSRQKVYQSDSLFVGEKSHAEVQLYDKSKLSIGENSLVVFNKIQKQDVANLQLGNFSLNVHGKVKLAIRDEIIEVSGKEAKIQIFIDKNNKVKPIIKSLQGKAKVVNQEKVVEIEKDEALPVVVAPPTAIIEAPLQIPLPVNELAEQRVYFWQLHDLYEINKNRLYRKEQMPETVHVQHMALWKNYPTEKQLTYVMISDEKDFLRNYKTLKTTDRHLEIGEAFVGKNYWRISYDQQNWSATYELDVIAKLRTPTPEIKSVKNNLAYDNSPLTADVELKHAEAVKGTVVEVSQSPLFPEENLIVMWTTRQQLSLPIVEPGTLYVRSRSVFLNNEISDYSNVAQIYVYQMQKPLAKKLIKKAKPKVEEQIVKTAEPQQPKRKLASEPIKAETRITQPEVQYNNILSKAIIDFETGTFQLSSADQQLLKQQAPVGTAMRIGYTHWFGNNGINGSFQSKLSDISSVSSGNPMELSAFYLRRISNAWISPIRLTALGGFEYYRNSGTTLFSPQYELMKIGASVQYPMWNHWNLGLQGLLGYGFDQSKQYEFGGKLQYYWDRRWFMGLGYRLVMFEAGSTKSAPAGLPYRETFEQGYGLFGYQF